MALLASLPLSAPAADFLWDLNASGVWSDPANWSGGVPPSASQTGDRLVLIAANFAPEIRTHNDIGPLEFADLLISGTFPPRIPLSYPPWGSLALR